MSILTPLVAPRAEFERPALLRRDRCATVRLRVQVPGAPLPTALDDSFSEGAVRCTLPERQRRRQHRYRWPTRCRPSPHRRFPSESRAANSRTRSLTRGDTEWRVLTRLHGSDSITRTWTDDPLALWRAFLKDCDGPDRRHEPQDTERTPA